MNTQRFRWISLAGMPALSSVQSKPTFSGLRDILNGLPDRDTFEVSVEATANGSNPADPVALYHQAMDVALNSYDAERSRDMFLAVSRVGDAHLHLLTGKLFAHGIGALRPDGEVARLFFLRALEMAPNDLPQKLMIAKELAKGSPELGGLAPDPTWAKELLLELWHGRDEAIRQEVGFYRQNGIGEVRPF